MLTSPLPHHRLVRSTDASTVGPLSLTHTADAAIAAAAAIWSSTVHAMRRLCAAQAARLPESHPAHPSSFLVTQIVAELPAVVADNEGGVRSPGWGCPDRAGADPTLSSPLKNNSGALTRLPYPKPTVSTRLDRQGSGIVPIKGLGESCMFSYLSLSHIAHSCRRGDGGDGGDVRGGVSRRTVRAGHGR